MILLCMAAHEIFMHACGQKIAATINEEKRHKERITQLQKSIDDWEGADLTDTSTMLLHEGALTKVGCGRERERERGKVSDCGNKKKRSMREMGERKITERRERGREKRKESLEDLFPIKT